MSVYIRDAQAMALPLVSVGGGEDSIHDWNLYALGSGHSASRPGSGYPLAYFLGFAIILGSVIICGCLFFQDEQAGPQSKDPTASK
jgi:hypothetical protein